MKLASMIMILIVIQGVVMFYDQVYAPDDPLGALEGYGDNESSMWNFIQNPSGWSGSSFLSVFLTLTSVAGLIGIGVYLVTKSDTSLFFGVFTLFLAAGSIPILSLRNIFVRNAAYFGCETLACPNATIAWLFTGGILGILYVLSVLEWWSGRSTG